MEFVKVRLVVHRVEEWVEAAEVLHGLSVIRPLQVCVVFHLDIF